jgi:predicted ATP-binding protein involved in virulence
LSLVFPTENNHILLAENGVGKTAIAKGLAIMFFFFSCLLYLLNKNIDSGCVKKHGCIP